MYRHGDYIALAHMGAGELREEMRKAREAMEHYHAYTDRPLQKGGSLPPLQPVIEKIKSCENYIIEIERRLGSYSVQVSRMMVRLRSRKIQNHGVNPVAVRAAALPAKMSASSKKRPKIYAGRTEA